MRVEHRPGLRPVRLQPYTVSLYSDKFADARKADFLDDIDGVWVLRDGSRYDSSLGLVLPGE